MRGACAAGYGRDPRFGDVKHTFGVQEPRGDSRHPQVAGGPAATAGVRHRMEESRMDVLAASLRALHQRIADFVQLATHTDVDDEYVDDPLLSQARTESNWSIS